MDQKKKVYLLLGVIVTVLVIGGVSFAYWYNVFIEKDENVVVTDCFKMEFVEEENTNIKLEKSYPIVDEEGAKLRPYQFRISNVCNSTNTYQINMESLESSTMPDRVIQVKVNENEGVLLREEVSVEPTVGVRAYKLLTGVIYPKESKSFEVRVWMDESTTMEDVDAMNKEWIGKITITASYSKETYKEVLLNGTDPVLKDGLIPVEISDEGNVKKADISSPWYSYEERHWANAVILNDESITYREGETIPESNIESYFVWIPRFKYQIFNEGKYTTQTGSLSNNALPSEAKTVEVEFETNTVEVSTGTGVGSWLTHPAFTSFDVNGMWVGKFETGYKGSTDTASAEKNVVEPESIQIKPNVNSWRSIQVSNAFYSTYDYKRELDSHMMKNIEWGSVAYLQHSKYGSMASVRINNNSDYVTGYSAVNEPTCGYTGTNLECNKYGNTEDITKPYNTEIGYKASTTGNISGIYDMSGGAWEYMMSVMTDHDGRPMSGRNSIYNSGFNGTFGCPTCDEDTSGKTSLTTGVPFPSDTKYYDIYAYASNDESYNFRILGDATGELGPFAITTYGSQQNQIGSWYQDEAWFVAPWYPWFTRSSHYSNGSGAGVFTFSHDYGRVHDNGGFRVVLSPIGVLE